MTTATLNEPLSIPAERLDEAREQSRWQGTPVLVSVSTQVAPCDALAFFTEAPPSDRIFWRCPGGDLTLVGSGIAHELTSISPGPARFAEIAAAWRDLLATAQIDAPDGTGPLLFGGFAFDPQRPTTAAWNGFPPGLMILPRILLTQTPEWTQLTTNAVVNALSPRPSAPRWMVDPTLSDPTAREGVEDLNVAEWKAAVAALASDVRAEVLEKAVLAREIAFAAGRPLDPAAVLRGLSVDYSDCSVFAFSRGDRCFLGATPERLVRVAGDEVQADCLAGSAPRSTDAEEDVRLGNGLLASVKDRGEYALVAQMLAEELSAVCTDIVMPESPVLRRLRNVQHLYAPVSGRLRAGTTLLELVARLHPTPAVGGTPRDAALARIRACEQLDRGWYAGPLGWMDSRGAGEFAVAIRSALLHGSTARVYAGCGIVGDSDPDAEYAETEFKLRAVLSALEEAAR